MKIGFFRCLLIVCSAVAITQPAQSLQTAPNQKTSSQKPAQAATKPAPTAAKSDSADKSAASTARTAIASDAPVITITGLCPAGAAATDCTKKVSRAEFEKILSARAPDGNVPAQAQRSLANDYVQLLIVANEGQKLGVDKDPLLEERLKLARLQLVAQSAARKVHDDSKPTKQEIEAFYKENAERFEELSVRRIYLPKPTGADAQPDAAKALAETMQKRAAAGEDTDKLEAEAYTTLKAAGAPPNTSLGWKRRGTIDARYEQQIAALQAGKVSEVLDDAQGYSIYKLESKRTVPLETVEKDIENALQRQRFEEKMKQLLGSAKADFNESYFGATDQPQPAQPGGAPKGPPRKPASPPKDCNGSQHGNFIGNWDSRQLRETPVAESQFLPRGWH